MFEGYEGVISIHRAATRFCPVHASPRMFSDLHISAAQNSFCYQHPDFPTPASRLIASTLLFAFRSGTPDRFQHGDTRRLRSFFFFFFFGLEAASWFRRLRLLLFLVNAVTVGSVRSCFNELFSDISYLGPSFQDTGEIGLLVAKSISSLTQGDIVGPRKGIDCDSNCTMIGFEVRLSRFCDVWCYWWRGDEMTHMRKEVKISGRIFSPIGK
ncbi:hypothetical protein M011DRAFT_272416 [Sporormia fimetaria CBS 119925]|uniref:Uncharacterized protein n=1 Tax=Sporormia fimetaria CBS 119925 TaxID=1340428 RepID=A0A6A6VKB8_9PLEO|nr:hypothetical protein M011DRAFT_272416 [Sporormia fimetaria CBS 119925]